MSKTYIAVHRIERRPNKKLEITEPGQSIELTDDELADLPTGCVREPAEDEGVEGPAKAPAKKPRKSAAKKTAAKATKEDGADSGDAASEGEGEGADSSEAASEEGANL